MHVKETNEIRELTAAEREEVAGGMLDPLSMLVGVVGTLAVARITIYALENPNLWEQVEAYANSQR